MQAGGIPSGRRWKRRERPPADLPDPPIGTAPAFTPPHRSGGSEKPFVAFVDPNDFSVSHSHGAYAGYLWGFRTASIGCCPTGGISRGFLLFQGEKFLRRGSTIRVMLVHGIFELFVIFLHLLFLLLLVQLVLIFR